MARSDRNSHIEVAFENPSRRGDDPNICVMPGQVGTIAIARSSSKIVNGTLTLSLCKLTVDVELLLRLREILCVSSSTPPPTSTPCYMIC